MGGHWRLSFISAVHDPGSVPKIGPRYSKYKEKLGLEIFKDGFYLSQHLADKLMMMILKVMMMKVIMIMHSFDRTYEYI